MKMTKPMMNADFSSDRTNAGMSVVSGTSSGLAGAGGLLAGSSRQLGLAGLLEHERPQRLDAGSKAWDWLISPLR